MSQHTDASTTDFDALVADACDEFAELVQQGGAPSVEEFSKRYPEIATILTQILPAIGAMKNAQSMKPEDSPASAIEAPQFVDGTVGDFRLVKEIGRGGMGVVYEAWQISLKRRVALKILPFAAALDSKRLERFKNEAQAAAQLHHANIVPVYAVGCERGVWYYAMQIIEGETVAEVISQLRGDLDPSPYVSTQIDDPSSQQNSNSVSKSRWTPKPARETVANAAATTHSSHRDSSYIELVVHIAIQVAEALEHAHSLDIVHRDVKPGNLIIDQRGRVWVTDFGLARFREDDRLTRTGDILGTLAYMSPEQASGMHGAVDHRTDIYSLGATLYELLTLQPPFVNVDPKTLRSTISSEEPKAPRRLNKKIPVDLETIVLKAISREPQLRYQSAQEVADDLRRFQDNRPVLARRPGFLELSFKWASRHRSIVAVTTVTLFLLVAILSVSTGLVVQEHARTEAALEDVTDALIAEENQRQAAEENLKLAQQNFRQAREMLEFFVEVTREDLAVHEDLEEVRSKLLQTSLSYYQQFIEQTGNNSTLQAELAATHRDVAKILLHLGATPDAQQSLEQALQAQERLVRNNPENEELRDGLKSMYKDLRVFYQGIHAIGLIAEPEVQSHLELDQEQVDAVLTLAENFSQVECRDESVDDLTAHRQNFQTAIDCTLLEIQGILSETQFQRLRQLELQKRGTWALSDPHISLKLELTPGQRNSISIIETAMRNQIRKCGRPNCEKDILVKKRHFTKCLFGVLTERQLEKWNEMTGQKFDFDFLHRKS